MMLKKWYILGLVLSCFLLVFATQKTNSKKASIHLMTIQKEFLAGAKINLDFSNPFSTNITRLFLVNSFGKIVLKPKVIKGEMHFEIPNFYAKKSGVVSWYLIQNKKKQVSGSFKILPNSKTKTFIENYLGPRTILAGKEHFTMMVVVPTDSYDNPVEDNTQVFMKDQFLNSIGVEIKKTNNFIAWKKIYSQTQSGKMLVTSECNKTSSKEIETEIYPSIATNFNITYSRNHDYADGNQITKIISSSIKDQYGNTVADGTLVAFQVITKNNIFLKTFGTTINGIAVGQLLHPDHAETYTVKAYVTGMAASKPIVIMYKPLIESFDYTFSNKNRTLTIGPLKSFMNQIVPDGIKISLKILSQDKIIEIKQENSNKGYAMFNLPASFYKKKEYQFEISALGITQRTAKLHYDNY